MRLFIFLMLCFFSTGTLATTGSLLSTVPRAYSPFPKFKGKQTSCRQLHSNLRTELLKMRKSGHKMALIFNNSGMTPFPEYRLRNEMLGEKFFTSADLVERLEEEVKDRFKRARKSYSLEDIKSEVRSCIRGRRMDRAMGDLTCLEPANMYYFHGGFVVLDSDVTREPYVVHFYGQEDNYLKGSIRVETLESYVREDYKKLCQATLAVLGPKTEKRVYDFIKGNYPKKLLAAGERNYNVVAHPWGLRTQNCNIWMSEVLASAIYLDRSQWPNSSRRKAKQLLAGTDFFPVKIPLTFVQSLARLGAPFVPGLNAEEGNIVHEYGVADIVPPKSIYEWLGRNRRVNQFKTVRGVVGKR